MTRWFQHIFFLYYILPSYLRKYEPILTTVVFSDGLKQSDDNGDY